MLTIEEMNARSPGSLLGLLGLEITRTEPGRAAGRLPVRPDLLAPNGYLHATSVVALADTCCGF
ncbi:MAG TPA: competence protein ComA, partial [Candidatus Limnocylindria bacterium]|nr:competence protein ComA [Candidatus Limnocylindria bacterium]